MISLEHISIGYHNHRALLSGINLTAGQGELVALVGRNGSGKSTLLRSLLGLIPLLEGDCLISGTSINHMNPLSRARSLSYVSSQVSGLPSLTVRELVSLGRMPHTGWLGKMSSLDKEVVQNTLEEIGLASYADQNLDQLSDGERQRVMIARALVQDTPHMVLDEPAAYLDIPNKYELVRLLSLFRDRGKTIVYSTHDLETALMSADKFWVITGNKVHEGSPEDLGMAGIFRDLYHHAGISFDLNAGRFVFARPARGRVSLSGDHGEGLGWTRHALERIGYQVMEEKQPLDIRFSHGKPNTWIIKHKESEIFADSLLHMARILTQEL